VESLVGVVESLVGAVVLRFPFPRVICTPAGDLVFELLVGTFVGLLSISIVLLGALVGPSVVGPLVGDLGPRLSPLALSRKMRTFLDKSRGVGSAVTGLEVGLLVGICVGDAADDEGKEVDDVRTRSSFSLIYPAGLAVGIPTGVGVVGVAVVGTRVGSDEENSYNTGLLVGVPVVILSKSEVLIFSAVLLVYTIATPTPLVVATMAAAMATAATILAVKDILAVAVTVVILPASILPR
jgi:hypothetical protein